LSELVNKSMNVPFLLFSKVLYNSSAVEKLRKLKVGKVFAAVMQLSHFAV